MISTQQAIEILKANNSILPPQKLPIFDCLGLASAEDVYAPIDVPLFDNSAMDGYVFKYRDYLSQIPIKVGAEIQAGALVLKPLPDTEAARIFTGAPVPKYGDTVVAQEDVTIENGFLKFNKQIEQGANIRLQGTQTKKGSLILRKNTLLTASYLGFLATFGIATIKVYPKPKIGIISTGKELVQAGQTLKNHQIFESNSIFLKAGLKEMGLNIEFAISVDDNEALLKETIQNHFKDVDILILTGGISVGDYDFVKPVLESLQTEELFYKVKQKPGKPLYFGRLGKTAIFALPGNPSAVVTCFYTYLKPYLKAMMGISNFEQNSYGILISAYYKKAGLTHFVKAFVENNKVEILPNQLSYQMDAYSKANAFAVLKAEQESFQQGEKIEVIKF